MPLTHRDEADPPSQSSAPRPRPPQTRARGGALLAVVVVVVAGACESPSSPRAQPIPPVYLVSADSLVPGSTATLRGNNMRQLRQVEVDGYNATFRVLGDTAAVVDVPHVRGCDIDGRRAEISINGSFGTSVPVRPATVLRLEVGESRVLTPAEAVCMQLPAAGEDYVLSVASLGTGRTLDAVFQLRKLHENPLAAGTVASAVFGGGQAARLRLAAAGGGIDVAHHHAHDHAVLPAGGFAAAGAAQAAFDDYAGAAVGDVLRFVDWADPAASAALTPDELPTYTATVVAVTPGQLIVIDDRAPDAASFAVPAMRQRFQSAANMVDAVLLDALRAVIRPDLQLPGGAGGRMVTTLMPMNGSAGSIRTQDIQPRVGASDVYHVVLNTFLAGFTPETIARIMIHEAAHLADFEPWLRDPAAGRSSVGWYSEAMAVLVEDVAARLATGSPVKARASEARWPGGVPRSSIAHSASPTAPFESAFGPPGAPAGIAGLGAYDRGARIVRYAQDQLAGTGSTLHQRLAQQAPPRSGNFQQVLEAWSVEAMAGVLDMPVADLLRRSMLADLTNDLVPAEAVERWSLPQIPGWNHAPATDRDYAEFAGGRLIHRAGSFATAVNVPGGGYAYWFIPGGNAAGLSLEATGIALGVDHEVRITRLR